MHTPHIRFVLVAVIALACSGDNAVEKSSGVVTIRGAKPQCATCEIVTDSVAYFPQPSDTLTLVSWVFPRQDSRGRFYAVDGVEGQLVHVFDGTGKLMRTFGKPGKGPGEFSQISDIVVGLADSLLIFEANRTMIFDPDYKYVREFQVRASIDMMPASATALPDGRVVLPSSPNHFSIMTTTGALDSISAKDPLGIALSNVDTARCMSCGTRRYSPATEAGTIWSGSMHEYVVERHDLSGVRRERIVREVDWYKRWPEAGRGVPGHEMAFDNAYLREEIKKARLLATIQTADGLIWTFIGLQDPDNPIPDGTDLEKLMMSVDANSDLEKHFVTMIEVIDPASGELLASSKFAGQVHPIRDNIVFQSQPDSTSGRGYRVMKLTLTRK